MPPRPRLDWSDRRSGRIALGHHLFKHYEIWTRLSPLVHNSVTLKLHENLASKQTTGCCPAGESTDGWPRSHCRSNLPAGLRMATQCGVGKRVYRVKVRHPGRFEAATLVMTLAADCLGVHCHGPGPIRPPSSLTMRSNQVFPTIIPIFRRFAMFPNCEPLN